jgi:hypothetical protein
MVCFLNFWDHGSVLFIASNLDPIDDLHWSICRFLICNLLSYEHWLHSQNWAKIFINHLNRYCHSSLQKFVVSSLNEVTSFSLSIHRTFHLRCFLGDLFCWRFAPWMIQWSIPANEKFKTRNIQIRLFIRMYIVLTSSISWIKYFHVWIHNLKNPGCFPRWNYSLLSIQIDL